VYFTLYFYLVCYLVILPCILPCILLCILSSIFTLYFYLVFLPCIFHCILPCILPCTLFYLVFYLVLYVVFLPCILPCMLPCILLCILPCITILFFTLYFLSAHDLWRCLLARMFRLQVNCNWSVTAEPPILWRGKKICLWGQASYTFLVWPAVIAKAVETPWKTKEKSRSSRRCAAVRAVPFGCVARLVPSLWCIAPAARAAVLWSLRLQQYEKCSKCGFVGFPNPSGGEKKTRAQSATPTRARPAGSLYAPRTQLPESPPRAPEPRRAHAA